MVAVMCVANIFITPMFMGTPREAVIELLPLIALFNVLKGGINGIVTFIVYKRISGFLHRGI